MLTLETMVVRLVLAVVLGALVGLERELVGKEAGIRTNVLVAAGAALFTLAGMMMPYMVGLSGDDITDMLIRNSGYLRIIASVVTGIGFLGAGIIVKQRTHVTGLTTAASVWFVAALGVLCGIGLSSLAAIAAVGLVTLLIILRKIDLYRLLHKKERVEKFSRDDI